MKTLVIAFLFLSFAHSIQAEKKHKHKHKHHKKNLPSHVHGKAELDISIEKNDLSVEIHTPAESFLGFEYRPRTAKEKATVVTAKIDWTKNFLKFFGLTDCKVLKTHWRQEFTGKHHSAIFAGGYIRCPKPLQGRELTVSLKKYYPAIDKMRVRLVGTDNLSKQKDFTTPTFKLSLSK